MTKIIFSSKYIPKFLQPEIPVAKNTKYCIFSILILFTIYNLTICPILYWRDSPEFIDTAFTLGIAHPAGFPAYSTISKLFTFIPLSNIAMRVNYVSLFFAVFTCWTAFHIIIKLISICFKQASPPHASSAAMLSVLILGSATSFWWMATVTEIYTMNCFFLSAFFLFAIKWYQADVFEPCILTTTKEKQEGVRNSRAVLHDIKRMCCKKTKYLLLASFVFGISTAVYGANLLFLPALLAFYFLVEGKQNPTHLILASTFFLLGYSIHLYLPIRSLSNPAFDWGNPETLENFVIHITDRKDDTAHFRRTKSLGVFFRSLTVFGRVVISEITIIGFALTLIGVICHFYKDKKSFFLFSSIALVHIIFFLTSFDHINNGSVFLLSFLIFTFWTGLGFYSLLARSRGSILGFNYKNIIFPVVVAFIVFSFAKDYRINNKSDYYLPGNNSIEMMTAVDQNAIVFTTLYWPFFRYFQDVENLRSDVSVVLLSDLLQPKTFNKVTPARFPSLNFPNIESSRENRHEFIQLLISSNIKDRPIYWELEKALNKYNYQYLIPGIKFLMNFVEHKVDKIPEDVFESFFLNLKNSMSKDLNDEQFFLDQEMGVRSYYFYFLTNFVDYLMKKNLYQNALPFLELALTLTSQENEEILTLKGVCLMKSGYLNEAEQIFVKLHNKNKKDYGYSFNLASLYFGKKELKKSKSYVKNTIKLNKGYIKSYFLIGQIYAEEKNYKQAIKEMTYAIEKTKFLPERKKMLTELERVKRLKVKKDNQQ